MLKTSSSQSSRYFTLCYFIHLHYMHIYLYSYFRLSTFHNIYTYTKKNKNIPNNPYKILNFCEMPWNNQWEKHKYIFKGKFRGIHCDYIHSFSLLFRASTDEGWLENENNLQCFNSRENWMINRVKFPQKLYYRNCYPMLPNNFELWWGK